MTALLFQEPDMTRAVRSRRQRRDVVQDDVDAASTPIPESADSDEDTSTRKRRRGKRGGRKRG